MPCTVFSPTFEILSTSCILVVFASICVMAPSSSVRLYLSSEVYASHNRHWVLFSTGSLDCVRFFKPCFLHQDPLAIRSHFLCLRLFSLYSFDDMITVMVWPLSCTDMVFPKETAVSSVQQQSKSDLPTNSMSPADLTSTLEERTSWGHMRHLCGV